MIEVIFKPDFSDWRRKARQLFVANQSPDDVVWIEANDEPQGLRFGDETNLAATELKVTIPPPRVPKEFIEAAELVAVHRDPRRWHRLYRILWRLNHGEPHLLEVEVDDDVLWLNRAAKSVGRDIHKMHAFVRFRKVDDPERQEPWYLAWHCPDHAIIKLAAPFFKRRFKTMHWSILTPDGSAFWDGERLEFGPGVSAALAPKAHDELESLWRSYYGAIFNPARIKTTAMKREMPVRHWRTLPETQMIPELLATSDQRVATMIASQPTSAAAYVPNQPFSLEQLRESAAVCRGCSLASSGCDVSFGEGAANAKIVIVADQSGDINDAPALHHHARQLLLETLAGVGVSQDQVYVTYAVKHPKYRHDDRQQRIVRIQPRDVAACRPWLGAELALIRPHIIVCLGAAAALAVLGRMLRLQEERGRWLFAGWGARVLVTEHPATILAIDDATEKAEATARFQADLNIINWSN